MPYYNNSTKKFCLYMKHCHCLYNTLRVTETGHSRIMSDMGIQGSTTSWVEEVRKILGSEFFKENVHILPVRNPMGAKHSYTLLLTIVNATPPNISVMLTVLYTLFKETW